MHSSFKTDRVENPFELNVPATKRNSPSTMSYVESCVDTCGFGAVDDTHM